MERVGLVLLLLILMSCFVHAGSWDSFEEDSNVSADKANVSEKVVTFSEDSASKNSEEKILKNVSEKSLGSSKYYTFEFYIALIFGVIGFLILIYFLYSFFRPPKDHWKGNR